jgi:hypothetical protein
MVVVPPYWAKGFWGSPSTDHNPWRSAVPPTNRLSSIKINRSFTVELIRVEYAYPAAAQGYGLCIGKPFQISRDHLPGGPQVSGDGPVRLPDFAIFIHGTQQVVF